jgi:hypothetical protein
MLLRNDEKRTGRREDGKMVVGTAAQNPSRLRAFLFSPLFIDSLL